MGWGLGGEEKGGGWRREGGRGGFLLSRWVAVVGLHIALLLDWTLLHLFAKSRPWFEDAPVVTSSGGKAASTLPFLFHDLPRVRPSVPTREILRPTTTNHLARVRNISSLRP